MIYCDAFPKCFPASARKPTLPDSHCVTPRKSPNSAKDKRFQGEISFVTFETSGGDQCFPTSMVHSMDSRRTYYYIQCFTPRLVKLSPVHPYKYHYCSARNGTKPEKEENKNHVQCPNYYCKDGRIIDNSSARDVRTSVVDGIPESSNRFFVRLKHLDVVHVALPIFHVARVVPRYHPALIVRPHHCPYRAVVCLNKGSNFS